MAQYTALGQEFLLLKNLETLRNGKIERISDTSLGTDRKIYRLVEINHDTFANAPKLKELHIISCAHHLSNDSLVSLNDLELLNLACNEFTILDVFDAIKLQPRSSLKTLILDNVKNKNNLINMKSDMINSNFHQLSHKCFSLFHEAMS